MPGCARGSLTPAKAPSCPSPRGAASNRRYRHRKAMRFSIIMPVLNEEAVLETTLIRLTRQLAGQPYELIIVDGGSSDSTVGIAERYGWTVRSPRGRATQMNAGAAAASGDVLLFLHADTQMPDNAFCAIEHTL